MYRSNTCGELRLSNVGSEVKLAGWVQKVRKMGGMTFVDLRDRYGITQIVFDEGKNADLTAQANHIGREWVIQVTGKVCERSNKNTQIPTGEIEIIADNMKVLSKSEVPPFTIEDNSDGGDDLRMQYRYLDLRRKPVLNNLVLRHNIAFETRRYLDSQGFLEVETPVLIKSTPEGARDFVVPSRMNQGQFYALPQSPQQFKQLLMVGGIDRYFQIVKCFRDEDLRADRQPEFTQIDCEMSYVEQEDVLQMFEGMIKHIFKYARGVEFTDSFPRLTWHECMKRFGSDKPDMRFGMEFVELKNVKEGGEDLVSGHSFPVFDGANFVVAICANGCASWTRKQLDQMTEFVKRPQVGAKGLVYIQMKEDGTIKSSVDKFYDEASLRKIADKAQAKAGDLILILCGDDAMKVRGQMNTLRLEMGDRLELRDKNKFAPLWVIDFPLFEWNEEDQRFYAMHHPFTSPKLEDVQYLDSDPGRVRANAYDLAMNGVELGGGSVRIHDSELQNKMFQLLGFTQEKAQDQFGCLMTAFKYGAPPHAGLAFGLDRVVSMLAGLDSIRDCIAFPKNNSGRDTMMDCPSVIDDAQLEELCLKVDIKE
ncbi:MAG: aspartate--tRNA ligase [Paludibacteraceae bacterium]|jgi:aspartyl-tRNA synthetase|nr:aspartate--tRNA ligase [Bacteroidales bacterium]MEE1175661.1 aspartate--tRNA ligase [Paludibacteraceae bacterium]MEE1259552.1 aspartate--tRNA ligase [Paludibacteraceae bacterium]